MKEAVETCKLQDWINSAKNIMLVSGEFSWGTIESYLGSRSISAMKRVLTKKRQGGDRWAYFNVDCRRLDFNKYWGE